MANKRIRTTVTIVDLDNEKPKKKRHRKYNEWLIFAAIIAFLLCAKACSSERLSTEQQPGEQSYSTNE